ncbi:MAG: PQQ-like beta-propeller repeat protein, partial [Planctomycetes bacterium]|nr:PQQ-like beta-propeller repeat protein [Planctomycetota bacterium]
MTDIPIKRREILRCVFRPAFPQILLVVTALVLFGSTMFDVGPDVERQKYVLFRLLVLIVAGTLLGLWAIFFSGWNKLKVSLAIAVLIGGFWGFFWVETNGDISPSSVHARNWVLRLFNARHEDDVAAQRREQAKQWKRPVELTPSENDFPGYRGADRTGVVNGPPIARDWNAHPPREVWKQLTFGGYSAFAVVNGYLFTLEQREEEEAVVCYDGTNGHELWVHSWPGKFTEAAGGTGPRTTPTVDNGEVFALGALGHLVCLDGKTGQRKWSVEVLQKNSNLKWAMSASPLVHGNLVIVNPG